MLHRFLTLRYLHARATGLSGYHTRYDTKSYRICKPRRRRLPNWRMGVGRRGCWRRCGGPWSTQFLALRDSFRAQWQPQGGIEDALIDSLALAHTNYLTWTARFHVFCPLHD